jgi:hypothetical protein
MPSNPFSTDYVGALPTQAAIAPPAPVQVAETAAAVEQPVGVDVELGFKITPIPMLGGKPRRVIIKGKVTRD